MRLSRVGTITLCAVVVSTLLASCVSGKKATSNPSTNAAAKSVSLTITANDVAGGKNAAEAGWITNVVIPGFEAMEKTKGVNATVKFQGSGVADEDYKTKLELNLKAGSGADVFAADGIWVGELASAGYIKPLPQVAGSASDSWDGWSQISSAVQQNMSYQGQRFGIPNGTDGRVLYFNKTLFHEAGLPTTWQPKSWQDILSAGAALKKLQGVTPIQINAGTPMGEATTTQGFLPLLVGTGVKLYDDKSGKWQGATANVDGVLQFYQQLYGSAGLGDPKLQQDQSGRDESFAEFSQGKIGMLLESDYLWRSIICPDKTTCGKTSMPDRNSVIGWASIPAAQPGTGVNGQNFVSVSGGTGWLLDPKTKYPQQAWDLMTYMASAQAQKQLSSVQVRISARNDVNQQTITSDPLLSFIASKVLPITVYRPSDAHYPQVSIAVQQATADVVSGKSPKDAAKTYQSSLEKIVGADHVQTG
jgi:multiple sugar transport system substrate-binding protein